jgi:hypothetical protein
LEGCYQCFEGVFYFHLQGVPRRAYCWVNSIGFFTYKRTSTPKQGNLSRLPENGCKNLSRNTRNNFPFNTLVTSQIVAILKGICPNAENLLKTGTNIIFSSLLTGVLLPP